MSDRDRDMPKVDWGDTTAAVEPGRTASAPGTGSLGSPPTDAPEGDDVNPGTDAVGPEESNLGGVNIGGTGKPGAGLGGTRGGGTGTGA